MASSAQFFCDHCGAANRTLAQFCRACGRHLADIEAPSSTLTGLLSAQAMLKQRYIILDQAGRGGFGAVYKASDTLFGGRLVAIKEMSQSSLKPQELIEATESFNQEAMLLASMTHPNLPRIYEQFTENTRSYLVMDFIEGETLEARLQKLHGARLPVEKVLSVALQLCSVLEYLHTRQPPVIFRDLKPGNIMITPAEHVYLIDFGIARNFKPGQEKDTTALGSYGYAPPEQYGKSQTTTRADIYSLGATLHQLLTGDDPSETPFQFTPLRLSDPTLAGLDTLVMSMVNVDVNKRPARIDVVRQQLQDIATRYAMSRALPRTTIKVAARPGDSLPPFPSLPPLSTIPAVPSPYAYSPPDPQKAVKKRAPRPTIQPQVYPQANMLYACLGHASRITHVAWSPDGQYLASASFDRTVQLWEATSGKHIRTYKGHGARVNTLAWSPDSKLVATASDDHTARIWKVDQEKVEVIFDKHEGPVDAIIWSPDGNFIASAGGDKVVLVWNATTYEIATTYREHTDKILALAWSPNGQYIASGGRDRSVKIWEPEKIPQKRSFWSNINIFSSHHSQKTWDGHTGTINDLAWSPDSKRLASACSDNHVRIRNLYAEHLPTLPAIDTSTIKNTVAWSPNGHYLAVGGNDKAVHIWNSTIKKETFIYYGHTGYVMSAAWSPDGSRLASAGVDRTIQVWQAV
ncbi:MAG: protein kinase [Ktedonobacteraceae bacterium]|nr:protein kinase [Ktedonobacteraceae bacterium]